ncbi:hypothetical protein [Stenotrophomonas sp. NPDC078853]
MTLLPRSSCRTSFALVVLLAIQATAQAAGPAAILSTARPR